jgi:hypothetical protein
MLPLLAVVRNQSWANLNMFTITQLTFFPLLEVVCYICCVSLSGGQLFPDSF